MTRDGSQERHVEHVEEHRVEAIETGDKVDISGQDAVSVLLFTYSRLTPLLEGGAFLQWTKLPITVTEKKDVSVLDNQGTYLPLPNSLEVFVIEQDNFRVVVELVRLGFSPENESQSSSVLLPLRCEERDQDGN